MLIIIIVVLMFAGSLTAALKLDEWSGAGFISSLLAVIFGVAATIVISVSIGTHIQAPAFVEVNKARYASLVYQAEAGLYENDNDIGLKELANQITEWNEELAKGKTYQNNIWLGAFYPDVYDQFEFIPMEILRGGK